MEVATLLFMVVFTTLIMIGLIAILTFGEVLYGRLIMATTTDHTEVVGA